MNCEIFNSILCDRAHGEAPGTHEDLRSHAKECAACATQLAAQEKLTCGLQALRVATLEASAPAALEARLLENFRRGSCAAMQDEMVHASDHIPAQTFGRVNSAGRLSSISTIWNEANRFVARRRVAFLPAFAAAMVLIAVVSLAMIARRESGAPVSTQVSSVAQDGNSNTKSNTANNFSPGSSPTIYESAEVVPVKSLGTGQPERVLKPRFANHRRPSRTVATRSVESEASESLAEVATEFLPLVEAESLAAMEGGQIVRVEMSRQALLSMGLPMNNERAHESVKADVLMGDDGLARAIRFVR